MRKPSGSFCFSSMETSFLVHKMSPPVTSSIIFSSINYSWKQKRTSIKVSAISYRKFIHFALDETKCNTHLVPSSLQEQFNSMTSMDGKVELQLLSFEAPKIRLLRSLSIETETMQVLDFGVFPKPEYDVPIFCANFFTSGNTNIILLDLNPLHDVISQRNYKEKYYKGLMALGVKYAELLPWGGKLTSESLKFFSPIVLWTKFTSSQCNHDVLFSAFMDYYKAWLQLMEEAAEEADPSGLKCNYEAQHRYLAWRAEKDPGHRVLKKLIGETQTKELLRNFLFNGIDQLGSKCFLDYFPEYRSEDGTVNERRSMVGKSFESRPWDTNGEFIEVDERLFIQVSYLDDFQLVSSCNGLLCLKQYDKDANLVLFNLLRQKEDLLLPSSSPPTTIQSSSETKSICIWV